jgi:triphosphatase
VLEPLAARLPDEDALRQLARLVDVASDEAYAAIAATLDSTQYTETLLALEVWVEGERWKEGAAVDIPVRDFARVVLKRLHRKVVKGIDKVEDLDEAALHGLRISAKKLRYASEFFRSMFRDKAAKSYLSALTAIQDRLGTLNDSVVARQIVADLQRRSDGIDREAFARGAGIVLGWNACRIAADLKRLPPVWDEFQAIKPFWK